MSPKLLQADTLLSSACYWDDSGEDLPLEGVGEHVPSQQLFCNLTLVLVLIKEHQACTIVEVLKQFVFKTYGMTFAGNEQG